MSLQEQLEETVHGFVIECLGSRIGRSPHTFESRPIWSAMRETGSELWLDTGSIPETSDLWVQEFSALTTNNTLLNHEIQNGQYDDLIPRAAQLLEEFRLSQQEQLLEIAFILNAVHGLKLVHEFDAFVSVEEHTDLANDVSRAVATGMRYHAICPERFIVKIPLTPAGLLATRQLSEAGVPVNHTLGFSARQNYVITRMAQPDYVNVFMGRLNSVVAHNSLGPGTLVGEKATLSSQAAIRKLSGPTRQIGASIRSGEQVRDVAGVDVLTIPPKAAQQFLELQPADVKNRTSCDYNPELNTDATAARVDTLWDINDEVLTCMDALEQEELRGFTPGDLVAFFGEHDAGDVLVAWTNAEIDTSAADGKIPNLTNWKDALTEKRVGLDSLMNLSGLNAFKADQQAMDDHVLEVLEDNA
ncbi:MAG: transaldolase [Kiritimatiellae bacterium]|nr:transaldolase [Kiritimatiellia bacterium]